MTNFIRLEPVNDQPNTKYILITGGVISGIGKGVLAASLASILKAADIKVTLIKIDPYINIDAGTFNPLEHGEIFVLDDGSEVDLILGNYERFLDVKLTSNNNITTGKIYNSVISKERRGDYLGKTVQVIPHITDEIRDWVTNAAKVPVDGSSDRPEVCIIELGGTIGDIECMPFVESFRQLRSKSKKEDFCVLHVSLVVQPKSTSEDKTKPTQATVREINSLGLLPDFIVCRSERSVQLSTREKISSFCNIDKEYVICLPDLPTIYEVPLELINQNIGDLLIEKLKLPSLKVGKESSDAWIHLANQKKQCDASVTIAVVGKHTYLKNAYESIIKSLEHAAMAINRDLDLIYIKARDLETNNYQVCKDSYEIAWAKLKRADGILIPGDFSKHGVQGKIDAIKYARENQKPFLGICLGFQLAAIEFARNVLRLEDANSIELDEICKTPIVIDMPEQNESGSLMKLGKYKAKFITEFSKLRQLYGGSETIEERYRHRFEVNPFFVNLFDRAGLKFVAQDETGNRMEILELDNHPYFVAVQYHPEYLSRPLKPSPPFLGLVTSSAK